MRHIALAWSRPTSSCVNQGRSLSRYNDPIVRYRSSIISSCNQFTLFISPLLVSAMRTFIQSPDNDQTKSSRDFAIGMLLSATSEIIDSVGWYVCRYVTWPVLVFTIYTQFESFAK